MTLLSPASALLAGLICGPILVLLYFLKLRRRPLRVSSTLLWERAVRDLQVNAPFRWLRPSWLLLLQALALACLAIAAGRPALDMSGPVRQRIVLLIDCSASMSALDGAERDPAALPSPLPPSRLDEARAKARRLAANAMASGSARVMVVAFAASPQTLCPLSTSRAAVDEAIDAARVTDQPADLAAALSVVASIAETPADESSDPQAPTVFLLTDGNIAPVEGRFGSLDIRLVRVGPNPGTPVENLAVTRLAARRDFEDPATVRVFAQIQSGHPEARQVRLEWRLDGAPVGSAVRTLRPAPGDAAATAAVPFDLATTEGGTLTVSISGAAGDVLRADDAAAVVLQAASRPRIVVVAPGSDGADADPFLLGALRALEPAALVVLPGSAPMPADADLIIFDRVTPNARPPVPTLSIGAGLPAAGFSVSPALSQVPPARFTGWQRNHPAMRYAGLETILIDPPMRLTLPESGALSLADGPAGPLIALVQDRGVRRLVIAFDLERSNWGPHYSFPLFIANAIDYLTLRGDAQAGRAFSTVEPVSLRLASGARAIEISGSSAVVARAEAPAQAAAPDAEPLPLGVISRAGVYNVHGAQAVGQIAVNLTDDFESLARTSDTVTISGISRASTGAAGGAPREIWAWFVTAALVLLSIEWFLFAWQMRP